MATIADPKDPQRVPIPAVRSGTSSQLSMSGSGSLDRMGSGGAIGEADGELVNPHKGGHLMKLSPTAFTGFQRRFFRISDSDCALLYWKTEPEPGIEPQGSINLAGVSGIHIIDGCNFAIRTPGRDYCLKAERPSEKDLWLEAISHVVNNCADRDSIEDARHQFDFSKVLVDATTDITGQVWDFLRLNKKATWLKEDSTPLSYSGPAKKQFLEAKGLYGPLAQQYAKSILENRTPILPERFQYLEESSAAAFGRLAGSKDLTADAAAAGGSKTSEGAVSSPAPGSGTGEGDPLISMSSVAAQVHAAHATADLNRALAQRLGFGASSGHLSAALQVRNEGAERGHEMEELEKVVSHFKNRRVNNQAQARAAAQQLNSRGAAQRNRLSTFGVQAMSAAAKQHTTTAGAGRGDNAPAAAEAGQRRQIEFTSQRQQRTSVLPVQQNGADNHQASQRAASRRQQEQTSARAGAESGTASGATAGTMESVKFLDHVMFGTLDVVLGDESLNGNYYCLLIGSRPLAQYQAFLPLPSVFNELHVPMRLQLDTFYIFSPVMDASLPLYKFDLDSIQLSRRIYETIDGFAFRLRIHQPLPATESLRNMSLPIAPRPTKLRANLRLTSIFGPDAECWRESFFACSRAKAARVQQRPRAMQDELMAFDLVEKMDASQKIDYMFRFCLSEVLVVRMHVHMHSAKVDAPADGQSPRSSAHSETSETSLTDPHELASAVSRPNLLNLIAVHIEDIPIQMPLRAAEIFVDQAGDLVAAAAEACYLFYAGEEGSSSRDKAAMQRSLSRHSSSGQMNSSGGANRTHRRHHDLIEPLCAPLDCRRSDVLRFFLDQYLAKVHDMLSVIWCEVIRRRIAQYEEAPAIPSASTSCVSFGSSLATQNDEHRSPHPCGGAVEVKESDADRRRANATDGTDDSPPPSQDVVEGVANVQGRQEEGVPTTGGAGLLLAGGAVSSDRRQSGEGGGASNRPSSLKPLKVLDDEVKRMAENVRRMGGGRRNLGRDASFRDVQSFGGSQGGGEHRLSLRRLRAIVSKAVDFPTLAAMLEFVFIFNEGFKQYGIYDNSLSVCLSSLGESLSRRAAQAETRPIFRQLAETLKKEPPRDGKKTGHHFSHSSRDLFKNVYSRFQAVEGRLQFPILMMPPAEGFMPPFDAASENALRDAMRLRLSNPEFRAIAPRFAKYLRGSLCDFARSTISQFQFELKRAIFAEVALDAENQASAVATKTVAPTATATVPPPTATAAENATSSASSTSPSEPPTDKRLIAYCSLLNSIPIFIVGCESIDQSLGRWNPVVVYDVEKRFPFERPTAATRAGQRPHPQPAVTRQQQHQAVAPGSADSARPSISSPTPPPKPLQPDYPAQLMARLARGELDSFGTVNMRDEARRFVLLAHILRDVIGMRVSLALARKIAEADEIVDSTMKEVADETKKKLLEAKLKVGRRDFLRIAEAAARYLLHHIFTVIIRIAKKEKTAPPASAVPETTTRQEGGGGITPKGGSTQSPALHAASYLSKVTHRLFDEVIPGERLAKILGILVFITELLKLRADDPRLFAAKFLEGRSKMGSDFTAHIAEFLLHTLRANDLSLEKRQTIVALVRSEFATGKDPAGRAAALVSRVSSELGLPAGSLLEGVTSGGITSRAADSRHSPQQSARDSSRRFGTGTHAPPRVDEEITHPDLPLRPSRRPRVPPPPPPPAVESTDWQLVVGLRDVTLPSSLVIAAPSSSATKTENTTSRKAKRRAMGWFRSGTLEMIDDRSVFALSDSESEEDDFTDEIIGQTPRASFTIPGEPSAVRTLGGLDGSPSPHLRALSCGEGYNRILEEIFKNRSPEWWYRARVTAYSDVSYLGGDFSVVAWLDALGTFNDRRPRAAWRRHRRDNGGGDRSVSAKVRELMNADLGSASPAAGEEKVIVGPTTENVAKLPRRPRIRSTRLLDEEVADSLPYDDSASAAKLVDQVFTTLHSCQKFSSSSRVTVEVPGPAPSDEATAGGDEAAVTSAATTTVANASAEVAAAASQSSSGPQAGAKVPDESSTCSSGKSSNWRFALSKCIFSLVEPFPHRPPPEIDDGDDYGDDERRPEEDEQSCISFASATTEIEWPPFPRGFPVFFPPQSPSPGRPASAAPQPEKEIAAPPNRPAPVMLIDWQPNEVVLENRRRLQGWVWRRGEVRTGVTSIKGAPSRLYNLGYHYGSPEAFGHGFERHHERVLDFVGGIAAQQKAHFLKHIEYLDNYIVGYRLARDMEQQTRLAEAQAAGEDVARLQEEFAKNNVEDDESQAKQVKNLLTIMQNSFKPHQVSGRLHKICLGALDGWRKMWCSVTDQAIYFYHDREDKIPADTVSLYSLDGFKVSQIFIDEKDETNTMFVLLYGERSVDTQFCDVDVKCLEVHLRVSSPEERAVWVETLHRMVTRIRDTMTYQQVLAAERKRYCENITSGLVIFDPIHVQPHHPDRKRLRRKLLAEVNINAACAQGVPQNSDDDDDEEFMPAATNGGDVAQSAPPQTGAA